MTEIINQSSRPVPRADEPAPGAGLRFPTSVEIIDRLTRACADSKADEASVVVCHSGERQRFRINGAGEVVRTESDDQVSLPASCMAKLFTATLTIDMLPQLGISLDNDVHDLLATVGTARQLGLKGVTLRQLLTSSHGLDDMLLAAPYPLSSDGFIDLEQVCTSATAAPPLIAPGTVFSYTDLGMLIVGALLERLTRRRFGDLLQSELLAALGMSTGCRPGDVNGDGYNPDHVCPTNGGALSLTATDLARLAEYFLPDNESASRRLETMRANRVAFPGWTNMGKSVGLGWHCYDGGWYGYNAMSGDGGSLMLRMHPEERAVIAVVSRRLLAYLLVNSAFADVLAECRSVRPPRLLAPAELPGVDFAAFEGRYESAAFAATVERISPLQLQVTVSNRSSTHRSLREPITRPLRLAAGGCFYTAPVERTFVPFGQFVELQNGDTSRRYLWNGRRLWRKVAA